jgi:hypothetical protein
VACARRERGLLDGVALHGRDPAWNAQDDAREREAAAADPADEVAQHLGGDVEVRDHAVAKRADRADRGRRPADHPARLLADRVDVAGPLVDRDHGGLEHADALAAHEHEGVRCTQVDRELATPPEPHALHRDPRLPYRAIP